MDFKFNENELYYRDKARQFVEEICKPLEPEWPLSEYDVPIEKLRYLRKKFMEYGFQGLAIPKEVGGQGAGTVAKCIVFQEIVKSPVTVGLLPLISGFLDPHPALFTAPKWQREKYLDPILHGMDMYHFLISEPTAGSDAAAMSTTAVKQGDHYIINGIKRFAPPDSHECIYPKYLLVYAVTTPGIGHKGISTFLVDYPSEGVSVLQEMEMLASGSYLGRCADWKFDNVMVPAKNLLGNEGEGFRYAMQQLNNNRTVIGARLCGIADYALDMAIPRTRERVTFGKPLCERQAIQWDIAASAIEIEAGKNLVYKTATLIDNDEDPRVLAAMTKEYCPQMAQRVIDRSIQALGGLGMMRKNRLDLLYWLARTSRLAEGSTEIMRQIIAKEYIKKGASCTDALSQ